MTGNLQRTSREERQDVRCNSSTLGLACHCWLHRVGREILHFARRALARGQKVEGAWKLFQGPVLGGRLV